MASTGTLAMFAAAGQIGDLILTHMGIERYGVEAEGNPLLREPMKRVGKWPVLLTAKGLGLFMVYSAYGEGDDVGLGMNAGITWALGVIPWLLIITGDEMTGWNPNPPI